MRDTARTQDRYSRGAIAFHWIIGLLVIVNLAIGIGHDALEGWPVMPAHKAIGITVLFLSLARLAWRLTHRPPPLPPMPGWQIGLAHLTHWLFYVLMIAIPFSGWWFVSAAKQPRPLSWFGLFDVPLLPVERGSAIAGVMHEGHEVMGFAMIALLVLHVAGALKHHLIDRDTTLVRMAPVLRQR